MKRWLVPVTIVEYGRVVLVEAGSKAEAARKARAAEWDDGSTATHYKVTVVGPVDEDREKPR